MQSTASLMANRLKQRATQVEQESSDKPKTQIPQPAVGFQSRIPTIGRSKSLTAAGKEDPAKKMKKLANISMGFCGFEDNSLADEIAREKEAE